VLRKRRAVNRNIAGGAVFIWFVALRQQIYPYLLKGLAITPPNQVWCADITYIRMERGFLYLVAIMDWYSRKVLAWRLSNTLEAEFCVAALKEALAEYGPPEIFNTDQGAQFTSGDWIDALKAAKVQISMDGKGRWIDNRMIERLWRSLNRRSAQRNTNASIYAPSKPGHRPEKVSENGWPITTPSGPTQPTAS